MSVLPSLVATLRQRTEPPPVPPQRDASEFDSAEEHAAYNKARQKAQARHREFKRPQRVGRVRRSGMAQPSASSEALTKAVEELRTRERRIFWGCNVETGRKQAPLSFDAFYARRKPMAPAERHAVHQQDAQQLPTLTSATKLQTALQQQQEWSGVTSSQVRRAVTAANRRQNPESMEDNRSIRRQIQKRLSATRPAVYPAKLQHKREVDREARRPLLEARRLERAQRNAQRARAVAIAQWAYDTCLDEERCAREHSSDELWYLRERRLDAGSALQIARGANVTPRWEYAESTTGPFTFIKKFGSEAEWRDKSHCPTCSKRINRCKCDVNDCSTCGEPLRRCKCAWFDYVTSDGFSGHPHRWGRYLSKSVPMLADSEDERVAELIRDYGPAQLRPSSPPRPSSPVRPPPPPPLPALPAPPREERIMPQPVPPPAPSPMRPLPRHTALPGSAPPARKKESLFERSFRNLRLKLPPDIDDERIASVLRSTDGHAGLALERFR